MIRRQPITRTAVLRLLTARRIVADQMRAARNAVIRQQLRQMRATAP